MAFSDYKDQPNVVQLLQRSLERGRLGNAYLFQGADLTELEGMARTLAKTLNCEHPPQRAESGFGLDCCDHCLNCHKIDRANHPDVLWVRPESKLRVIKIDQIRALMKAVYLKPTQARFKLTVIVGADRLMVEAANAFLKTLEEPPADSILILLTTEPQRLLETIVSRCLRLNFGGESGQLQEAGFVQWLERFAQMASVDQKSLLGRYQLLSVLLSRLNELKTNLTETFTRQSPLEQYEDIESGLREKWEKELAAAIESEYRRLRADVFKGIEWWLRDVWLETQQLGSGLVMYPELAEYSKAVAARITPPQAAENLVRLNQLQRMLNTNVQEALALEVTLLKLSLGRNGIDKSTAAA